MNENKKDDFNPIWIVVLIIVFIILMYYKTFTDPNKEYQLDELGDVHLMDNTNPLAITKLAFIVGPILLIIYLIRSRNKK